MFNVSDMFGLLPEIILSGLAIVLLMLGVMGKNDRSRIIVLLACLSFIAAFVAMLVAMPEGQSSVFGGAFAVDNFARTGRGLIYIGAIISLLLAGRYFENEGLWRFEYPVLVMLAAVGMGLMVCAQDLISVYMGIELQSLSLYILAAFNRNSRRSTEAGLKYFVLGALSSGMLLYGASLVYGFTGATSFSGIAAVAASASNPVGLIFGLVFLMAGLAFKISAAPFHMWTPDVYEGAPTPVTAFFAAAPKIAGMFLFVRVMMVAFPDLLNQWQPIVWLIAALSMIVGSFSALMQTNIKRLMAYSSIGHVGYALMGLAAGTQSGVAGVVLYMSIYMIMTLGTFACILAMRRPEGMAENIEDLAGLSKSQPGLALAFTALFFSLAGIPPFLGFFAKLSVFTAAVDSGLYILAIVGVLTSVVATFYYLTVIRTIWFKDPAPAFVRDNGLSVAFTSSGSAFLILVGLVVLIRPLNDIAAMASRALF